MTSLSVSKLKNYFYSWLDNMNLWACWSRVTSQRRSQAFTYYLCRTKVSWKCRIIKMSTCMMVCIWSWWVITKSSSDHVNWSCDEPDMNNPISKRVLSRPAKCNDLESLNIIELVIFLNFVRFLRLAEPPCPSWSVTEGRILRLESVTIQKIHGISDRLILKTAQSLETDLLDF